MEHNSEWENPITFQYLYVRNHDRGEISIWGIRNIQRGEGSRGLQLHIPVLKVVSVNLHVEIGLIGDSDRKRVTGSSIFAARTDRSIIFVQVSNPHFDVSCDADESRLYICDPWWRHATAPKIPQIDLLRRNIHRHGPFFRVHGSSWLFGWVHLLQVRLQAIL